jgi:hypothetical protein
LFYRAEHSFLARTQDAKKVEIAVLARKIIVFSLLSLRFKNLF